MRSAKHEPARQRVRHYKRDDDRNELCGEARHEWERERDDERRDDQAGYSYDNEQCELLARATARVPGTEGDELVKQKAVDCAGRVADSIGKQWRHLNQLDQNPEDGDVYGRAGGANQCERPRCCDKREPPA